MESRAWVVNTGDSEISCMDMSLKKELVFRPRKPIPLPVHIALKHIKKHDLKLTDHPERYFVDEPFRHLIIRDAGIGDLLMLEPILEGLARRQNHAISIYSRFPGVFMWNPAIAENIAMEDKDKLEVDIRSYDTWDDLRNYSETCDNREKIHRTDCYNQRFRVTIEDHEPKIYFSPKEKAVLKRKEGKRYIGLCCDASHSYRRYEGWKALGNQILAQDPANILVLLGATRYMKYRRFGSGKVIDLQGKTDARELILAVRDLDALVSVDSGPMHIAASMHIPTVGIFSIIKPELRLEYYKGPIEVVYRDDLPCAGCGSLHMAICKYGDKKEDPKFNPPCLDLDVDDIVARLGKMEKGDLRTFVPRAPVAEITFPGDRKPAPPKRGIKAPVAANSGEKPGNNGQKNAQSKTPSRSARKRPGSAKGKNRHRSARKTLTMPIIVQNEEANLPRFIELVMSHPSIGRVVAIDGGSTDKTVELLEKAGAEVYVHPWLPEYHDMVAMQRNISCSYVPDGTRIFIMDLDECFSKNLADYLPVLAESDIVYGEVPRRTYEYYKDIEDVSKRIKDYPDYQPRFYTWNHKFKYVRSPHHVTVNVPAAVRLEKGLDIIHFEREGKDRDALEGRWKGMWEKTKAVYLP